jgi:hypothetical protein
MRSGIIGLVLACVLQAPPTLAQAPSGSRLDDIIKSGKLRVCTPATTSRSASSGPTAVTKASTSISSNRPRRRSASK